MQIKWGTLCRFGSIGDPPFSTKLIANMNTVGLDTRHTLTYNERAHKQNIIYGCANAMIYLFNNALSTIEQ